MEKLAESFSGVRGTYPTPLSRAVAYAYAFSFMQFLGLHEHGNNTLVIGRDTRASGMAIVQAFAGFFVSEGWEVFDIGESSTPATEQAVRHFGAAGGVMITASHNPPEQNGWKLLSRAGSVLSASDMQWVIDRARQSDGLQKSPYVETGMIYDKTEESREAYARFVSTIVGEKHKQAIKNRGFKIIFDCGGGAVIPYIKPVCALFGITPICINAEPGFFGRSIEPTKESLANVPAIIKEHTADFAIAFDADADRAEIMLANGECVSGHHIVALLVDEILSDTHAKAPVVVNDATSDLVSLVAKKHGIKTIEVEVGESNVVSEMNKIGSKVGGEGSSGGGIVAPQMCRDGLLACLIIVRHLTRMHADISKVLFSYPAFYTVKQNCTIEPKPDIRKFLKKYFLSLEKVEITQTGDEQGGLKIRFKDGAWVWFRQSRTEPSIFRVLAESKNEARAKELLALGVQALNS